MKILDKIFVVKDGKDTVDWEYVESIPEFAVLKNAEQSPKWHKEGNAWNHTQNVVNEALKMCEQRGWRLNNEPTFFITLVGAALFHDIGKGVTTFKGKDNNWHSYGHEDVGEKITRRLLWDEEIMIRERICKLVKLHMKPLVLFDTSHFAEEVIKLIYNVGCLSASFSYRIMFDLLIKLKECDVRGSILEDEDRKKSDLEKLERLVYLGNTLRMEETCLRLLLNKKTNDNIPNVFMMFGLPGSGKDTFIKRYCSIFGKRHIILCRDDIRAELGYCKEGEKIVGTKEQEEKVSNIFNLRLKEAIKKGQSVIINNINLKKKYRDSVKELLKGYDVWYEYIYVGADSLKKNIERRKGQISEEAFINMINAFDWPDVTEYDSLRIEIN